MNLQTKVFGSTNILNLQTKGGPCTPKSPEMAGSIQVRACTNMQLAAKQTCKMQSKNAYATGMRRGAADIIHRDTARQTQTLNPNRSVYLCARWAGAAATDCRCLRCQKHEVFQTKLPVDQARPLCRSRPDFVPPNNAFMDAPVSALEEHCDVTRQAVRRFKHQRPRPDRVAEVCDPAEARAWRRRVCRAPVARLYTERVV